MLKLVTSATSNIITIEEAQNHLRVDSDDDITYVESLIYAAEKHLSDVCGRRYVGETYDLYLDGFIEKIYFPIGPVASITSVKYQDGDDAEQSLVLDTDYYADIISDPSYIKAVNTWPSVYDKPNAVVIRFVTGITSPELIPLEFKQAALLLIGEMYAKREDHIKRFPTAAQRLISNLRRF